MSDPINPTSVLQVLSMHIGKANGIRGRELAEWLTQEPPNEQTKRCLRRVIKQLRCDGYAVCGIPGEGYYMAANNDELQRTRAFLWSRCESGIEQIAAMGNIAVPDLKGQLRLKT